MVAVTCQQMYLYSVHAHDTVHSAAAEEFQNGTYLKNIPRKYQQIHISLTMSGLEHHTSFSS
jgi:hypothetical protein